MDVQEIHLRNYKKFEDLKIAFAPTENHQSNITVFIGNNGSGKTSLLRALATSLSWLVARIGRESGKGNPLKDLEILNGENFASINIQILNNLKDNFEWQIAKTRKGRKDKSKSTLKGVTELADFFRESLTQNPIEASLPLIAFYPVSRVVLDIPLKIRKKHSALQLDGYDNSLSSGVDFRRFFEWFREREDIENESTDLEAISKKAREEVQKIMHTIIDKEDDLNVHSWYRKIGQAEAQFKQRFLEASQDRQLNAVRNAIYTFMPKFKNLKVKRKPRLHMAIDKNGQTLDVAQLSQGEKSIMALVGDIARRLAMMNPSLENPLEGDGIVLIDEIEMHLHPKWQRSIISRLTTTFPNCQFVLTTHSPLVISDPKNILVYSLKDGELEELPSLYGEDTNSVLLGTMDTEIRNTEVDKQIADLLDLIQDSKIEEAKNSLQQLKAEISADNIELIKAGYLLQKQELRLEKNK